MNAPITAWLAIGAVLYVICVLILAQALPHGMEGDAAITGAGTS